MGLFAAVKKFFNKNSTTSHTRRPSYSSSSSKTKDKTYVNSDTYAGIQLNVLMSKMARTGSHAGLQFIEEWKQIQKDPEKQVDLLISSLYDSKIPESAHPRLAEMLLNYKHPKAFLELGKQWKNGAIDEDLSGKIVLHLVKMYATEAELFLATIKENIGACDVSPLAEAVIAAATNDISPLPKNPRDTAYVVTAMGEWDAVKQLGAASREALETAKANGDKRGEIEVILSGLQ